MKLWPLITDIHSKRLYPFLCPTKNTHPFYTPLTHIITKVDPKTLIFYPFLSIFLIWRPLLRSTCRCHQCENIPFPSFFCLRMATCLPRVTPLGCHLGPLLVTLLIYESTFSRYWSVLKVSSINLYLPYTITIHKNTSKSVTNINNTSKSEISKKVYIKLTNQLNTQYTNIPICQNTAIWREKAGRPKRPENGLPLYKS